MRYFFREVSFNQDTEFVVKVWESPVHTVDAAPVYSRGFSMVRYLIKKEVYYRAIHTENIFFRMVHKHPPLTKKKKTAQTRNVPLLGSPHGVEQSEIHVHPMGNHGDIPPTGKSVTRYVRLHVLRRSFRSTRLMWYGWYELATAANFSRGEKLHTRSLWYSGLERHR